jgi:hypothetical protein
MLGIHENIHHLKKFVTLQQQIFVGLEIVEAPMQKCTQVFLQQSRFFMLKQLRVTNKIVLK